MAKSSFRSLPNFSEGKTLKVDRENDKLNGVQIAQYGKNKNESFFDDKFLDDLVKKGNEHKPGIKCRFGHPNMCSSSLGAFVGRYTNFRREGNKVFADLSIDPLTKKTSVNGRGVKMYDYIMDMAENNPDMFGNSIVIMGDEYKGEIEYDNGEKKMETIKVLHSLLASDLVDDPAATDNLFSFEGDMGVAITEFLDQNPEIFKVVEKDPKIVLDFFERYDNYEKTRKPKKKKNMSLFDKFKSIFDKDDKKFDVDLTLATGDVVTVVTENETPQVGDEVRNAEGVLVPDDNHLLQDGRTVVTVNGLITEILPAESGEGEGEGEQNSAKDLTEKFDSLQNSLDQFKTDIQKTMDLFSKQILKQEEKLSDMGKKITGKKFDDDAFGEQNPDPKGGKSVYEKAEEVRKQLEEKRKNK